MMLESVQRRLRKPLRRGGLALLAGFLSLMFAVIAAPIASAENNPVLAVKPAFGIADSKNNSTGQPATVSTATRFFDYAWSLLLFEQHKLTQDMTGAVRNVKTSTSFATATGALVMASFVYGILHAVGPGHGKAVISSYMLADKETLRRGVFLAFLSSFIQALSAICLIGGLYLAARASGLQTRFAEAWLETASWGCVALLGAWLMAKQMWRFTRELHRPAFADQIVEDPAASAVDPDRAFTLSRSFGAGRHEIHEHDADRDAEQHAFKPAVAFPIIHPKAHVHDEHCGHVHMPGPDEMKGDLSWGKAFALALSVGIRPCTGALLVIIFASTQGSLWAGILATFAMALGTALTVSALAALTVGSRNIAITLAGQNSRWGSAIANGASFLSSATVFILGSAFFIASLAQPMRPF